MFEADFAKLLFEPGSLTDDVIDDLAVMGLILDRGNRGDDCETVHVVRILDRIEGRDQIRIRKRESDAHSRQGIRLRHRAQDDQVRELADQVELRLGGEIDVRLIEHHDPTRSRQDARDRKPPMVGAGR